MNEIKLSQSPQLRLEPRLILTVEMRQSLEMLQMPVLELADYVKQELEVNPALEDVTLQEQSLAELELKADKKENSEKEELIKNDIEQDDIENYFDDASDTGYIRKPVSESEQPDYENLMRKSDTLSEHLEWQLRASLSVKEDIDFGLVVISEIDDAGYFKGDIKELAERFKYNFDKAQKILKLIQSFDPAGIGAGDLKECILIQLIHFGQEHNWPYKIIENCFELVQKRKISAISKKLGITAVTVKKALDIISRLNPHPGLNFGRDTAGYIVPDVIVQKMEGEYAVLSNQAFIPRLRVNPKYKEMYYKENISETDKEFIKEKVKNAHEFLRNLSQRESTIVRIAREILSYQYEFFEKGIQYLKPMLLEDIAKKVELHISTVSRATSGKYMQTQSGIFNMKFFFSTSVKGLDEEKISQTVIKDKIKELIIREDKQKPLTDKEIQKNIEINGIKLTRRAITKYRTQMGIMPTHLRKQGK